MRKTRYKRLPFEAERYQWDGRGEYLQWWYFDAEFESGHRVMTIMLPRMFGAVDDHENGPVPGITLVIMDPERKNHHSHAYYPDRFEGDTRRMRATFGDNLVECVDGRFRLEVRQGELGFDLEYTPFLTPWPPFPGTGGFMTRPLLWTLAPGKYFNYVSMIPRGGVEGSLYLPGGEVKVKGEGYHEQGRTDAPFTGIFSFWYWTRFFLDDWTFIFPVARSPWRTLHAPMRALLVYRGDECVADLFDVTGLALDHDVLEYQDDENSGRDDVPRRCLFKARTLDLKLQVEMDLFHRLEGFRFEPFTGKTLMQPAWLQHVMRVRADLDWKGQPYLLEGEGIFETMLTGNR